MGKRSQRVQAVDPSQLGIPSLLEEHAIADAISQIEHGIRALRTALLAEAQRRAETLTDDLRTRLLDAEGAVERALSHVPGLGPALAMRLFRATHAEHPVSEESMVPSNAEDTSNAQIEPGGVASSAYLQHVGLA